MKTPRYKVVEGKKIQKIEVEPEASLCRVILIAHCDAPNLFRRKVSDRTQQVLYCEVSRWIR